MRPVAGCLALVAVVAVIAPPPRASAQTPSRYLYVATITAEFGRLPDFIEYERQIQEARRRVGDSRAVSVYQIQVGGEPNRFDAVIGFNDFAELDSWPSVPDLLASAYGERDGGRIYAEGSATIESVEYAIHVTQPGWSSGASLAPSGSTLTNLVTTTVRPALADDYEAFLMALKVAEDKRGIRRVRRNATIGDLFTYTAVSQAGDWSTLRSTPGPEAVLIAEYGEEVGRALIAKADAAVVSRTISVFRIREDMSYSPN